MKKRYLFPADYMADPSVHVFNGRVYIYPSHDWECENVENDNGDQYVMKDYHVLSTDDIMNGQVVDHGKVIGLEDIPWAGRQLWDCDVQEYEIEVPTNAEEQAQGMGYSKKTKRYIMYFPMSNSTASRGSVHPQPRTRCRQLQHRYVRVPRRCRR